jgi:hypothetical protein
MVGRKNTVQISTCVKMAEDGTSSMWTVLYILEDWFSVRDLNKFARV